MRDSTGKFIKVYNDPLDISTSVKLPRELNLACKLSPEDIQEIRDLYSQGNSSRFIAKKFRLSKTTVLYWVHDDEYRRQQSERCRKYKSDYKPELQKAYRKRLKKLIPNLAQKERVKANKPK